MVKHNRWCIEAKYLFSLSHYIYVSTVHTCTQIKIEYCPCPDLNSIVSRTRPQKYPCVELLFCSLEQKKVGQALHERRRYFSSSFPSFDIFQGWALSRGVFSRISSILAGRIANSCWSPNNTMSLGLSLSLVFFCLRHSAHIGHVCNNWWNLEIRLGVS